MSFKICIDCYEFKSLEEYPNVKKNKDGKGPRCKPCNSKFIKIARNKLPLKEDKTCIDCHELKPLDQYPNEKRNNDGKGPRCKLCNSKFLKIARDKRPKKEVVYKEPPANVKCNKCFVTKSSNEFYIRKKSGKVDQPCKPCSLSKIKKRSEENRENFKNSELKERCCVKCNNIKTINMFRMNLTNLSGFDNKCTKCCNEIERDAFLKKKKNKEWKRIQTEKYKKWREKNKEINSKGLRITVKLCGKCNITKNVNEFPVRLCTKDGLLGKCRMCWREDARNLHTKRKLTDSEYKIAQRLRNAIRNALVRENTRKKAHTEELLGASIETVRKHLEYYFEPGMTWKNHGWGEKKWNIEHTHPISAFYLEDLQEQKRCFSFTNLRPMWHVQNMEKANTFDTYDCCLESLYRMFDPELSYFSR